MAVNPTRTNPTALLREIRDLILEVPDDEDPGEDLAIELFRKLLQIDVMVGDTKARNKIRAELDRAREAGGREEAVQAMERVLA